MAAILAVHGISQQYEGGPSLKAVWLPAMRSGIERCNGQALTETDVECAFYGDAFRGADTLGTSQNLQPDQFKDDAELALLAAWWQSATSTEPDRVPPPDAIPPAEELAWAPTFVHRALSALAQSRGFSRLTPYQILGDLRQVHSYMTDMAIRDKILLRVASHILPDTRVVVGHSLGSVVAYEALCRGSLQVNTFVTLGSPLGTRNTIFDRLRPPPSAMGIGQWPGDVRRWVNISDRHDIVALEKELAPFFSSLVVDKLVDNGWHAHDVQRYLTAKETGEAITDGL